MPHDEDIKANLAYARSQVANKIKIPDPGLLGCWMASLQGLLTIDETAILAWALYLVMAILALLAVFLALAAVLLLRSGISRRAVDPVPGLPGGSSSISGSTSGRPW